MISDCYRELMTDPSLLQSFLEDEWMSVHGLPYLHAINFCIVLERLFPPLTFSALWGKAGADFITKVGRRAMTTEITPLAILVTDGVGEGKLGMITAFCRTDQAKVERSDSLSTLVQRDSTKPGVVVVKAFTNSPHLPQWSFGFPSLDVTTLSASDLTAQFPLSWLHLHRLLPYSSHSDHPSMRQRGRWAKHFPSHNGDTVGDLRREALLVLPLPLSVPIVSSYSNRDISA